MKVESLRKHNCLSDFYSNLRSFSSSPAPLHLLLPFLSLCRDLRPHVIFKSSNDMTKTTSSTDTKTFLCFQVKPLTSTLILWVIIRLLQSQRQAKHESINLFISLCLLCQNAIRAASGTKAPSDPRGKIIWHANQTITPCHFSSLRHSTHTCTQFRICNRFRFCSVFFFCFFCQIILKF